jgi:hypothetical protein
VSHTFVDYARAPQVATVATSPRAGRDGKREESTVNGSQLAEPRTGLDGKSYPATRRDEPHGSTEGPSPAAPVIRYNRRRGR